MFLKNISAEWAFVWYFNVSWTAAQNPPILQKIPFSERMYWMVLTIEKHDVYRGNDFTEKFCESK